jgi:hypothetical protein
MEDVDNMDTVRKSPIKLDHATLRTIDPEGTRNFLEAVLDLTPGYRPAFPYGQKIKSIRKSGNYLIPA